jgi:hypothetical protein
MRVIISLILYLTYASSVLALSPPALVEPPNNSTINSPTFNWQNIEEATQYRIIIDDESSVSSPYIKNYYTTNNKYSPSLNPGIYYWKVAVKDSGNNWSIWSEVWSVIVDSTSPTPQSSIQSENSPIPTASAKSSFTISAVPTKVTSSEDLRLQIDLLLPSNPNSTLYLKGAFKKIDGSNYFGLTKVNDTWIKNGSSYSSQFKINTDNNGRWSGILEVKADYEDSGFAGSGDYLVKVARYNSSGSGPNWSNEEKIYITLDQPEIRNINSPTPIPTSISEVAGITKENVKLKSSSPGAVMLNFSTTSATISPSVDSTEVQVKSQKSMNFLPILGGLFIISSISYFLFMKFNKK